MKLFFDNCTSPVLAETLGGFVAHLGHAAHHVRGLPCGPHATDFEWISMLAPDAEGWVVITGDGRIHRNKAERAAFRQAGLKGIVLAPAYQKAALHETAALLVWRWPKIEELVGLVQAPALYEMPINRHAKLRSLPL